MHVLAQLRNVSICTALVLSCYGQQVPTNPTGRPIGGGEDYGAWVTPVTMKVSSRSALLQALNNARSGDVIYVDNNAEIDLTSQWNIGIPAGVTLASGRGQNGSLGALLYTTQEQKESLFRVLGSGVRITGLRLRGPSTVLEPPGCGRSDPQAITIRAASGTVESWPVEIDNTELWAWPGAAVTVDSVAGVNVHHNFIHHNRRHIQKSGCTPYGLGYGVQVRAGSVIIEANLFSHNRHDITSNGDARSHYTARYNLVLDGAVSTSFDVHGFGQTGSTDCELRGDGSCIAGHTFVIHDNTFLQSSEPAVHIRGVPENSVQVYRNRFLHPSGAIKQSSTGRATNTRLQEQENRYSVRYGPAWFVSWSGESFWQLRRFDATPLNSVAARDFTGDGRTDLFRTTGAAWDISRSAKDAWQRLNTSMYQLSELAFGDFDGLDGTDVFRATGETWDVSAGGSSHWQTWNVSKLLLGELAFGDFDGDGRTDVLRATGTSWQVSLRGVGAWQTWNASKHPLSQLAFGDFNGDRRTDVFRATGESWQVSLGANTPWQTWNTSGHLLSALAFGDFNGDGRTDVLRPDGSRWHISWSGQSSWETLSESDSGIAEIVLGDFNGDKKTDVMAMRRPW